MIIPGKNTSIVFHLTLSIMYCIECVLIEFETPSKNIVKDKKVEINAYITLVWLSDVVLK